MPFDRRQTGYNILEVLVAVLVLSGGLLGLAGMQVITLRNNSGSYMRTQAAVLAQDLADRIAANNVQARNGTYVMAAGVPGNAGGPGADSYCMAGACSTVRIAAVDLWQWYSAGALLLPSLQVMVECPTPPDVAACGANSVQRITVMWDETRSGIPNGTACDPANVTPPPTGPKNTDDLSCYRLSFAP